MAIPESQLKIWAKRQSTQKAIRTHKTVRKALKSYPFSRTYNFRDYLQGSYINRTNIYADTDVDIVVQLNSVFRRDISRLTPEQLDIYEANYSSADYGLPDFKKEILKALKSKFDEDRIEIGKKAIKIKKDENNSVYDADIVVALQYRLYVPEERKNTTLDSRTGLYFYEGITFKVHTWIEQFTENFNDDGEWIINYPKLHYKNGVDKNKKTFNKFKPVVRIFKNMRNKALDEEYLESKNTAPSYFIQCLLYNVPNDIFKKDTYQETVENILDWLSESLSDEDIYSNFVSQNEIVPLFGSKSDKWNVNNAREYIKVLFKLWNDWNKGFLDRLLGI